MRRLCALLFAIIAVGCLQLPASKTYTYSFAESSPLAVGRWIKISTAQSGIYEISHEKLRELGFPNPEAVGVFGDGGAMCSFTFENFKSRRMYEDTPVAVPVWHENDRMFFYARGIEDMAFNGSTFSRSAINLYSFSGAYLLTDSQTPLRLDFPSQDEADPENPDLTFRDYGYDYLYHEQDLFHNSLGSGRLFWGENFLETPELTFPIALPFAYSGLKMTLAADIACYGGAGRLTATLPGYSKQLTSPGSQPAITSLTYTAIPVPATGGSLTLSFSGDAPDIASLDKWILSYAKRFPLQASLRQERIAFTGGVTGPNYFRVPEDVRVLDVTAPALPKFCVAADNLAYFTGSKDASRLIVFDPTKQQLQPEGYSEVANQDLHALQFQYNSLLIITMPEWREYADRIAELHRQYDRIGVAVVEPQQVYDEFSGGKPDPMAYRALIKMLFQSRTMSLKNVLFLGPVYADSRNVRGIDRPDGFVSFLHPYNGFEMEEAKVPTVLDWPGYVGDVIYNENYYFREPVEVGVGYLPIVSKAEAELAVSKIEDYLSLCKEGGLERYANRIALIGGEGNDGMHHNMAVEAGENFQKLGRELSDALFDIRLLSTEATSNAECRDELTAAIEEGTALTVYFGHGGSCALNGNFWDSRSFMTLNNRPAGFMLSAGCRLSEVDLGRRGVGDAGVIEAPHALVGAITSTRTIFAERNEKIMKAMQAAMLTTDSVTPRHTNATIGEIYALGKSLAAEDAEAAFYYVGDPALTFPLAVNPARIHTYVERGYIPGEVVRLFGSIMESDGEFVDSSASGDLLVRIYAPEGELSFSDGRKTLPIPGELIAAVKGTFAHGRFSDLNLKLDESLSAYQRPGEEVALPIYITGYDSKYGRAYCGNDTIRLAALEQDFYKSSIFDTTPPEISLEHEAANGTLLITAVDETALQGNSSISVMLDGRPARLSSGETDDYATKSVAARFPTLTLEPGLHKLEVKATDLAGNKSQIAELEFAVSADPLLRISADSRVAVDKMTFEVEGYDREETVILHIVDADNRTVYRDRADAAQAVWNCSGATPGNYRAALLEDSPAGAIVRSPWFSFSVIR